MIQVAQKEVGKYGLDWALGWAGSRLEWALPRVLGWTEHYQEFWAGLGTTKGSGLGTTKGSRLGTTKGLGWTGHYHGFWAGLGTTKGLGWTGHYQGF